MKIELILCVFCDSPCVYEVFYQIDNEGIDAPKPNFVGILTRYWSTCTQNCQKIKSVVIPKKVNQKSRSCQMTLKGQTSGKIIELHIVGKRILFSIR